MPEWVLGTGSAFFLVAMNAWAVVTGRRTAAGHGRLGAAVAGLVALGIGVFLAWIGWVHWRRPLRHDPGEPLPPTPPTPAAAGSGERARRDAERTVWRSRRMP